jgi:CubicO group peptidase (beta-lactamase class C family)
MINIWNLWEPRESAPVFAMCSFRLTRPFTLGSAGGARNRLSLPHRLQAMTDVGELAQRTADKLVGSRHVGVVVAAVRGDEVAVRCGGHTAVDGPPMRTDTLFEIGSVTKVFTALLLARSVLAGKVTLDEPVRDLLPPGTAVPTRGGREITVRHLSMHSSGLPRLPHGMLWPALRHPGAPDPYAGCTAEALLDGLAATKLRALPGARVRYSNLGVGLLGLALATRWDQSYESLVTEQVCAPLGLADTRISLDPAHEARFTQGHTAKRRPTPPWHLAALAGAGGLRSTGPDLAAFLRAHLDADSRMAEAIRLCLSQEQRFSLRATMHLGWIRVPMPKRFSPAVQIGHDGGTGGFRSFVGYVPNHAAAVAVVSNTARWVSAAGTNLLRVLAFGGDLKR